MYARSHTPEEAQSILEAGNSKLNTYNICEGAQHGKHTDIYFALIINNFTINGVFFIDTWSLFPLSIVFLCPAEIN